MYHGEAGATEGEAHFTRVHQDREEPENIDEILMTPGRRFLWSVLKDAGLAKSTSEARRLIQQGAIAVDRVKVTSTDYELVPGEHLVQVGRRQFKRLIIPAPQV